MLDLLNNPGDGLSTTLSTLGKSLSASHTQEKNDKKSPRKIVQQVRNGYRAARALQMACFFKRKGVSKHLLLEAQNAVKYQAANCNS